MKEDYKEKIIQELQDMTEEECAELLAFIQELH